MLRDMSKNTTTTGPVKTPGSDAAMQRLCDNLVAMLADMVDRRVAAGMPADQIADSILESIRRNCGTSNDTF